MKKIFLEARAKINLCLHVLGKRPDGYHEIISVMQSIALSDEISLTKTTGKIGLETSGEPVTAGEDNLVLKAAYLLRQKTGCSKGATITLKK